MRLAYLLTGAAALLLVLLGLVWTNQRRLLYFPEGDPGPPPEHWVAVTIPTGDGLELAAWHRTGRDDGAPIVIVFPGNGGNRAGRLPFGNALAQRGFDVLLVDYRGYGGNSGSPSEDGIAEDARSAVRFAEATAPDRPLAYFGESLGAAVATGVATELPPDALVLGSPFTSLADVGAFHYPWAPRFLYRESYPSLERFRSGALDGVPVLVIAGSADSVVPVEQSRTIAEAAGAELYEVARVEHNDPAIRSAPGMVTRVADFITQSVGGA